MESPDRSDMQGMLRYGYGRLKHACYLMLTITQPSACKAWLAKTTCQSAAENPAFPCNNIAFSATGLLRLGLTELEEIGFSRAFIEGMDTDHRNRTLGDFGQNDPRLWEWGSRAQTDVHLLLMIFARSKEELEEVYAKEASDFDTNGLTEMHKVYASYVQNDKGHYLEHFGFRDGLSQPVMRGTGRNAHADHLLNPGEFVLGYPNEYGKYPHSPVASNGQDLGKNGSYMVFRQLEQDVATFWKTLHAQFEEGDPSFEQCIWLGSKMVGRKPDGEPLVQPDPAAKRRLNAFRYYQQDAKGYLCPFGSHIRRTNPRDTQSSSEKEKSLESAISVANRHRILRRGRPYGEPVVPSMDIKAIINACLAGEVRGVRGLNFICFNTDIDRQFEFVQHTWSNNPKFAGLYQDVDPIIGVQGRDGQMIPTQFEVPAKPVRKRYKNIPAFTTMKGGGYFFLPGLKTLQYLSTI